MPLPPALAARLAKRGILKSAVNENGQLYSETVTRNPQCHSEVLCKHCIGPICTYARQNCTAISWIRPHALMPHEYG